MFAWLVENGWALWLLVFLVLAVIEMLTLDLFFIMMSVGALASMVSYFAGAPVWLQIVLFCVVALAMIVFVRPIALNHLRKGPAEQRTNVDRLIGHAAVVVNPSPPAPGWSRSAAIPGPRVPGRVRHWPWGRQCGSPPSKAPPRSSPSPTPRRPAGF